ncbi:hypothetical protein K504DRAFT_184752 [Pleomassaria siparia CBS 279.74]|uniref:Zn(2)-C6 fungal-type domain-containing protein n=1 Tax=Pleomassaria siparia CBS 279.74 TaxID=1314801 RepID=A0A6G1JRK7_9PLEO|nr:hypothetical protein K504DRAFT_184752 [Pleomassaria siparia CBS 279.74]
MLSPFDLNMEMDMDTEPGSSNSRRGPGLGQKTNRTRLRTSCDACQNLKVKCSQDKPSCRRCSKNGLDCVYSPLRRMGRPKRPTSPSPASLMPTAGFKPCTR